MSFLKDPSPEREPTVLPSPEAQQRGLQLRFATRKLVPSSPKLSNRKQSISQHHSLPVCAIDTLIAVTCSRSRINVYDYRAPWPQQSKRSMRASGRTRLPTTFARPVSLPGRTNKRRKGFVMSAYVAEWMGEEQNIPRAVGGVYNMDKD